MYVSKIKEFLFKVIHNICSCKEKLYIWKISDNKFCKYCPDQTHTFKHMIWDCNAANNLWIKIEKILAIKISYQYLIMGKKNLLINNTISVIMYCIYKKFLKDYEEDNTEYLERFVINELYISSSWYQSNILCADLGKELYSIAQKLDV